MDVLELLVRASTEEIWLEEKLTGQRFTPPLAFWRSLSESLRAAGYHQYASIIDQAIRAAGARERLFSEKLSCMEPTYDQETKARCQTILAEELRSEG